MCSPTSEKTCANIIYDYARVYRLLRAMLHITFVSWQNKFAFLLLPQSEEYGPSPFGNAAATVMGRSFEGCIAVVVGPRNDEPKRGNFE